MRIRKLFYKVPEGQAQGPVHHTRRATGRLADHLRVWAVLVVAVSFGSLLRSQPALSGKVSGGFSAPSSTDAEGRRHVVKGKEVERRGANLLDVTEPRVTRFNPDDTADMFIESARCLFDNKAGVASSATNLVVRTADSRFRIEGVGWNWDLSGSLLTISNDVVAVVRKAALAGEAGADTNKPVSTNVINISSRHFEQEGDAARFIGSVLVRDGNDAVHCDRLNIQFVKPGGAKQVEAVGNVDIVREDTRITSGRALYDLKDNLVTISEHPIWNANQRSGSADLLVLRRAEDSLSATGSVYMKLPLTNMVLASESTNTNAGTNRFLEIHSDRFFFENARSNRLASAHYSGAVKAAQNEAMLQCEELTANFGVSNRLTRLHAVEQVELISNRSRVSGREADYDLESDKVEVMGDPRWQMDENRGRSKTLVFSPRSKQMTATGDVEVTVTNRAGALFSVTPETSGRTNSPLKITAQELTRSTNVSVFRNDVVVRDDRGTISCAVLTIQSGETNQAQRIVAEEKVVIKQPDLTGYGERAEYDQKTGLVRLTGHPELIGSDKHLRADAFVIDRNRNTFSVSPGKYRIELQLSKKQNPAAEQK